MPLKILDFASDAEEAAWLDHNWAELAKLTTNYGVPGRLRPGVRSYRMLPVQIADRYQEARRQSELAIPATPAARSSPSWSTWRSPEGSGPRRRREDQPRRTS